MKFEEFVRVCFWYNFTTSLHSNIFWIVPSHLLLVATVDDRVDNIVTFSLSDPQETAAESKWKLWSRLRADAGTTD